MTSGVFKEGSKAKPGRKLRHARKSGLRSALCNSTSFLSFRHLGLASAPLLSLAAPVIAAAQDTAPSAIGDYATNPSTGETLTVIAVLDGAVLTEDYQLILTDPRVGASVPDPADASLEVLVTAVTVNDTTGRVETVTLEDGRTIAVARDVSAQILPSAAPDTGSANSADPLPAADENRNLYSLSRNSGDGGNGSDSTLFASAGSGGNGSTLGSVDVTIDRDIEANGGVITLPNPFDPSNPFVITFRNSAASIYATGGDGGNGGDGSGFLGFTRAGAAGGNGGAGPTSILRNDGTISVSTGGLYGMIVSSTGGDGGDGGDGAFGFTSNAGDGGNAGSGGVAVINNSGQITTYGSSGYGAYVRSLAGRGGSGGDADTAFDSEAGDAGFGANGGTAIAANYGIIQTFGARAHGILGQSVGGGGGSGGDASGLVAFAGSARAGGDGGSVILTNTGLIDTAGTDAIGMLGQSIGGGGGDSGNSGGLVAIGASGGAGSNGGSVDITNSGGSILTSGARAFGVLAQSIGGGGGSGGTTGGLVAIGSSGSGGGRGGGVEAVNSFGGLISTTGLDAHGILAQSIGGGGGTGGSSGSAVSLGGSGGGGGNAGTVLVTNTATLLTEGANARGIMAQSIGGGGGNGGSSGGLVTLGGAGSGSGNGNRVDVDNTGLVMTSGLAADGIVLQSIGGGGGNGGSAGGLVAIGGNNSRAGHGFVAEATNSGRVITEGNFSRGILAQSIGGGGGSAGASGGLISIGGRSSAAGNGSTAAISNTGAVSTSGLFSNALQAQSIGGGGGTGGSSGGVLVAIGGRAGGGGAAGAVNVFTSGLIETAGAFSNGIYAQSVGGGGGDGGQATSLSAFVGVAVGGRGGSGGGGGTVTVSTGPQDEDIDGVTRSLLPVIRTGGDFSNGIFAQSVGGGGGNGGAAVQGTIGAFGSVSIAVGGRGGSGGAGGQVNLLGDSVILTDGDYAHGTLAQSVGGGGGNGGGSVAVSGSAGVGGSVSVAVGVGGVGGSGGIGGEVNFDAGGFTGTSGDFSHGIFAQSVGGGGGNGGFAVSIAAALADAVAVAVPVGVGGSGGSGGRGGLVDLDYAGNLLTEGVFSSAMLAQSVGGGGGNGGFNISGALAASGAAAGGVAVGVGGTGGGGGNGGTADSAVTGNVMTTGDYATALVTQSVGGSGGNGGYNVSGSIAASGGGSGGVSVGVGGSGGGAGAGTTATSLLTGNLLTTGANADGILTQSVGGGGGNGALNVSGSIAGAATGAAGISVGVGGSGGSGGAGGTVTATVVGDLETRGAGSAAFTAQSLGGGGGNGALNVSGSISGAGTGAGTIAVGVGGSGGSAGSGGTVTAALTGTTITSGIDADAIVAQSVGGSGGNGGVNVSAGLTLTSAGGTLGVGVGGAGGTGGSGMTTILDVDGLTATSGADSTAILAQSLGGGGGNGAVNVGAGVTLATGVSGAVAVGIGGKGGGGGTGGTVTLGVVQGTMTTGDRSAAIVAQSIGGGGGNGGVNVSGALSASTAGTGALNVGVGGFGGSGGIGGSATATVGNSVSTRGADSGGILVQSLGGGGGNGALSFSAGVALSGSTGLAAGIGVGGFGGTGGNGSSATLTRTGDTVTEGALSNAITVQSLGGGGGNGGTNIAGGLTLAGGTSIAAAIGVGGFGGSAGGGGTVTANVAGSAIATGAAEDATSFDFGALGLGSLTPGGSHGLFAQSVGGSGGSGGVNISGGIALGGSGAKSLSLGLGGFGSGGGAGGNVTLTASGEVYRGMGDLKAAVFAQSVGGGGGDGAVNVSGGIAMDGTLTAGVGGFGAAGGAGGTVDANVTGMLSARGIGATGFLAQSLGGGGGNGGVNVSGGIGGIGGAGSFPAVAFGMGGTGGDGSAGGAVTATHAGAIGVTGAGSDGIQAQSVGGGGGNGGFNVAAAVGGSKNFNLGIGVGGSGGAGSAGGIVTVTSNGAATVDGRPADGAVIGVGATGITAQSIGGGGGNAGFNIAGAGTNGGAPLTIGIGGSGAAGGAASAVTVTRGLEAAATLAVMGSGSTGILAQSIGGGGGNAGGNLLLSASLKAKFDVQLAIGGAGGEGGDGGAVTVTHIGEIAMAGQGSGAIMSQSIGGGGGNANLNINASLVGDRAGAGGEKPGTKALDLQIGGGAGAGSDGGAVIVDHTGSLTTDGDNAAALFAQSIGGGGGNAAENYQKNFNDDGAIAVAIGRRGGTGGIGGAVDLTAAGLIQTLGLASHGIHAQSIGGGGGNSETTSVSVEGDRASQAEGSRESATFGLNLELAIGLEGGEGSRSGAVTVGSAATISTVGDRAHGIYAQSIGGGGGNGGAAVIDRVSEIGIPFIGGEDPDSELSLAFQLGGAGGTGAEGGLVNVASTGSIMTSGEGANAIRAISLGGGGGDAGAAFNIETPGDGDSLSIAVALGGSGGTGAIGGAVIVTNTGLLQTTGAESSAILAQSIGGGGGNAGLAGNFSYLSPASKNTGVTIDYNAGGTGGIGAAAGNVTVANGTVEDNSARILTTGAKSHGILAQSIGGGGGNGGSTLSGNFANASNSYQLAVNLGGEGGVGGTGGMVTVENVGRIETRGDEAHGIFAQSIGGGGGNGGFSLASGNLYASKAFPKQALIAVGGGGGSGNDAGDVLVDNTGTILTGGRNAHGIFAQSLGGGGGNMSLGFSATFSPAVNAGVNFLANAIGFALGARPGDGGLGGQVTVNQLGDVVVTGRGARAVVAESINGGGGGLTIDLSGIAGFLLGDLLPGVANVEPVTDLPALTLFGGAAGQGEANADKVTVNIGGTVAAAGDFGAGNSQQSVGGGGGHIDLALAFTLQADDRAVALPLTAGLGGSDSTHVAGGEIASAHQGDAITEGRFTPALFLQSVGGGGGRSILEIVGSAGQLGEVALSLGGTNQANAAGGAVAHVQTGAVATFGDNAIAMLAQSIGGGGGLTSFSLSAPVVAGAQAITAAAPVASGSLVLGSAGGSALDGGSVDMAMTGAISTAGANAPALLLQSIGGGGGLFQIEGLETNSITLGGSEGASGSGGAILLENAGTVRTDGVSSHAVVLQSIGGGGGAVFGASPDAAVALASANSGDGGAIGFAQTGDVVVTGDGASAIVAQSIGGGGGLVDGLFAGSAGGAGSGGAVGIVLDGNVSAQADNATAILAQSLGSSGAGPITLELAAGRTIVAGLGGTAIAFDGGSDNRVTNRGTLMTLGGLAGLVMTGTGGNDALVNAGLLTGNVALGGGANSLANLAGATLLTGPSIDLGAAANLFTNSGVLAPGDVNTIAQTALAGSFAQTATGTTFLEVDLATDRHDSIDATGTVTLAGSVDARLLNTSDFMPGEKQYRILTGQGGATLQAVELRADSSVVFNLRGLAANGNAVELRYDLSFAPDEAVGNLAALGDYLDRVQTAGVPDALAPTFDQLIAVQDAATYLDQLTQLSASFYAEQDATAIGLSQEFGDRLTECGGNGILTVTNDDRVCAWLDASLQNTDTAATPGTPASSGKITSLSGGAHYQIGNGVTLAAAVGYDDLDLAAYGGAWNAQGDSKQLGIGAAYDFGSTRIGVFATYGEASFATTRALAGFGALASGDRSVKMLGARVTARHRFDLGGFAVVPGLTAGLTRLSGGDGAESGAASNDLSLGQSGGTQNFVMPEVRVSYDASFADNWSVRPFVHAALRQHLSDPRVEIEARFLADNTTVAPFIAGTSLDRSQFIGEAGLEVFNRRGITIGASYRLEKSSSRDGNGGRINLVVPF